MDYIEPVPTGYKLSGFLRRSLIIFIVQGFRHIVFISSVIFTTFRPICSPAFIMYLSPVLANIYMEYFEEMALGSMSLNVA